MRHAIDGARGEPEALAELSQLTLIRVFQVEPEEPARLQLACDVARSRRLIAPGGAGQPGDRRRGRIVQRGGGVLWHIHRPACFLTSHTSRRGVRSRLIRQPAVARYVLLICGAAHRDRIGPADLLKHGMSPSDCPLLAFGHHCTSYQSDCHPSVGGKPAVTLPGALLTGPSDRLQLPWIPNAQPGHPTCAQQGPHRRGVIVRRHVLPLGGPAGRDRLSADGDTSAPARIRGAAGRRQETADTAVWGMQPSGARGGMRACLKRPVGWVSCGLVSPRRKGAGQT